MDLAPEPRLSVLAAVALLTLACGNGPWHIPREMRDEGIAAWSYVEPRLAERSTPLPPVTVADFASLPPEESYHPNLGLPSLIVPLVGWIMPPTMRLRNVVLLPVPSLRIFGEYESATLRRYEFERILSRELVRSGVFERVVADPRRAELELRGRVDFERNLRVHGLGLGLLYWPLLYWVPGGTLADRCDVRLEMVRLRDGQVLTAERFSVESRAWVVDIEGNELLLLHLGREVLPRAIARIVDSLATAEIAGSHAP